MNCTSEISVINYVDKEVIQRKHLSKACECIFISTLYLLVVCTVCECVCVFISICVMILMLHLFAMMTKWLRQEMNDAYVDFGCDGVKKVEISEASTKFDRSA